jgi:hypothetical protein
MSFCLYVNYSFLTASFAGYINGELPQLALLGFTDAVSA